MKQKHNAGSKTEREKLAKQIVYAMQQKGHKEKISNIIVANL